MAVSRSDKLFKPKKSFQITAKTKFKTEGFVRSVCQIAEDRVAILVREKYRPYIQTFDLKSKQPVSKKIYIHEDVYDAHRLPDGKILCGTYWEQFIVDLDKSSVTRHSTEHGHFIGMLNDHEFVVNAQQSFSVINLDSKIPPIKVTLGSKEWPNFDYPCQIWSDETIAVHDLDLKLYRRKDDKFSCVDTIKLGTHQETLRSGENLIVKNYCRENHPDEPMLRVFTQKDGKWTKVPGAKYKPDDWRNWLMKFKELPGCQFFVMEIDERIMFFDTKTLHHLEIQTDFGDYERDAEARDYMNLESSDDEEPHDFFHGSLSVLENGKVALGYEGYFRILTVQPVKELKDEKELKKDSAVCRTKLKS